MSKLNTRLDQDVVEDLGIWQAATMDGYWDDKANLDIQYVYLLGQLRATESVHLAYGNRATLQRIRKYRQLIAENRALEGGE